MLRRLLPGLRGQLVALSSLGLVGLTFLLVRTVPLALERELLRASQDRSLTIAEALARDAEAGLDSDDAEGARLCLEAVESFPEIDYALLRRPDGTSLATWGSPKAMEAVPAGETFAQGGTLLHVRLPVRSRVGAPGSLQLGYDIAELDRLADAARQTALSIGLAAGALGVAVAFGIGAVVVRPLRRMTRVARRIAAGDASARADLDVDHPGQVGELAVGFDRMLVRLGENEARLRAAADEMEHRVEARTAELAVANRELAARLDELSQAQEQLVVADRRISIGRLAAGVAHEINNPLAFIDANLSYSAEAVDEARQALASCGPGAVAPAAALAEVSGALADARQGADRVRQIVRQLRDFSRDDAGNRGPASVPAALRSAMAMAAHETRHRARLVERIGPTPPVVVSDVRLSQVLLNLLVNAAQAIPEGRAEENEIRVKTGTDARGWATIEVSDTGSGMTPEVKARLFQPFFTTKPRGVGTGLGLSISQGIVAEAGGAIEVESAPGRGTTFRVSLPPSDAAATAAAPLREAALPRPARVLVIDDEELVGEALRRALREHLVTVVRSGEEGLARIRGGGRFDVILCDVMMPGMSGPVVREALQREAPEAARSVVFMTGGGGSDAATALRDAGAVVLEKPFDVDGLRRMVAERA